MPWNGMQSSLSVKIAILAAVKNIEPTHPKGYGSSQQQNSRIKRTAYGDPCSGEGNPESNTQHKMRPTGESFGIGIQQQNRKSDRRQEKSEPVELPGREY